ncbi:hypothetical protein DBZ36_18155 [Alginatibacterium sediminis]|uniref:Uncharacterized protein n=1 Tax=Alginatibacterium sediminis TaxID=2164068 RepID=A0A420E6N6_9ALTE|nr:hypothetical protein [Alginatibacterium sediminis]RKF13695.1 hypothetical protein DBZ36_18155 [Alginatibacterium sediminis]
MNRQKLLDEIRQLQQRADELEQSEKTDQKVDRDKGETTPLAEANKATLVVEEDLTTDSADHIDADELMQQIRSQVEESLSFDDNSKQQLAEILKEVEQQFEQLPKKACLAVFTAGILLGKFLR